MKKAALLLAVLLLLSLFTACSLPGNSDNTTESPQLSSDNPVAETDDPLDPKLAPIDGDNDEFVILGRTGGESYIFPYDEMSTEDTSDRVSAAIFKRNSLIEEKYNVSIISVTDSTAKIVTKVENEIQSGSDTYDVVMPMLNKGFLLATQGAFYNVEDIPHIDTDKDYWISYIMDATSVGKYNFFAVGDMNISAFNTVGVTFFNKDMLLNNENLYEMVTNGTWTLDTMMQLCADAAHDLTGDGMDTGDTYGLTINAFAWQPFFYGTGMTMVSKDAEDMPKLSVNLGGSESMFNYLEKLNGFFNDTTKCLLVNQYDSLKITGGWGQASIDMFKGDRALFWVEIIYGLTQIKDMESNYGILPMPKKDANQSGYISYIHANHSSVTAVMTTNDNLELTGSILEDMAYYSYIYVRPEFYEIKVTTQYSRDAESYRMLKEYIYEHIIIDMAQIMSESGLAIDDAMRSMMITNRTNYASMFTSQGTYYQKVIDGLAEKIIFYGSK